MRNIVDGCSNADRVNMHVTATIGTNRYETVLSNSRHNVIADENAEHSGADLGPNPGELLMMSLASCTAITLRMYADRKQWQVAEIVVTVEMVKQENKTLFNKSIRLNGNLDETQRSRMISIAKACPVQQTLTHPIEINTILV